VLLGEILACGSIRGLSGGCQDIVDRCTEDHHVTTQTRYSAHSSGEILKTDFLAPLNLSVNALSKAIKVPRARLNDIVRGKRGVSAATAMRLARYLGVSAQFWMNLQSHYELEMAEQVLGDRLGREIRPYAT
jgi:antitoxin HigA-1